MAGINATDARVKEVVEYALDNGDDSALETFGISPESLPRYKREYKTRFGVDEKRLIARQLIDKYTEAELKAIVASGTVNNPDDIHNIDFSGKDIAIGVMSDLHIGSKYFSRARVEAAFSEFEKYGVKHIFIPGDVTEGMNNRPGHIYELSQIGYNEQRAEAIEVLSQSPAKIYAIDGNHDRWYIKSNGAKIVQDIASSVDGMTFIGHDVATVNLSGVKVMLWHGEDGGSYATSYRPQKIIESIAGGKKPQIIFAGHDHKSMYLFDRNIHFIASGTLQEQTPWMRGKRLVAHVGFWIINMTVADGEVKRFSPTWYPYYV